MIKISQLKSTEGYLTPKDRDQLVVEMTVQNSIISNSLIAESEVKTLREKIAKIESSGAIVSHTRKLQAIKKIEEFQKTITQAQLVQGLISKAENDSGFCSDAKMEKLQNELVSVLNILRRIQPLSSG